MRRHASSASRPSRSEERRGGRQVNTTSVIGDWSSDVCSSDLAPNDPRNLDMMEWQAKDLKIDSWKGYTADGISGRYPSGGYYGGWYLDDVKVAYPMYEKARKLGIKTF